MEDFGELLGCTGDDSRIEAEEQAAQRSHGGSFYEVSVHPMSPVDRVVLRLFLHVESLYQFAGAVNRLFEMAESSRVRFDTTLLSAPAHLRSSLRIVETLRTAYLLTPLLVDNRAVAPLKLET